MARNPYFDDGPDDETNDGFDVEEETSLAEPSAAPEMSGQQGVPAWAQISSDLVDEPPAGFEPVAVPVLPPAPQRVSRPAATVPAPPVMPAAPASPPVSRPSQSVPEPTPVPVPQPAAPVPAVVPTLPAPVPQERVAVPAPVPAPESPVEPAVALPAYTEPSRTSEPSRSSEPSRGRGERDSQYDEERDRPRARRGRQRDTRDDDDDRYDDDRYDRYDDDRYDDEYDEEPSRDSLKGDPRRASSSSRGKDSWTPEDGTEKKSRWGRKKTAKDNAKDSGKGSRGRADDSDDETIGVKKQFAGGRAKVLVFRIIVWGAILVLMALGVKQILAPVNVDIPQVAAIVKSELGGNGFPVETGAALSEYYAQQYLTLEPGQEEIRTATLTAITAPSAGGIDLALGGVVKQSLVSGPFLISVPVAQANQTVYTYAARIETTVSGDSVPSAPQWVYLSVPVIFNDTGIAIGGGPGFMPPSSVASEGSPFIEGSGDAAAAASLTPELPGFFEAWASSNTQELSRYLPSTASDTAKQGMEGLVSFVRVDEGLIVGAPFAAQGADASLGQWRKALVTVTWEINGATVNQQYRLLVIQGADSRWYVQDIKGGGFM